jgi:uncharacterized membrane protein
MIQVKPFPYKPGEHELEKASNSYVMSLIAIAAGLPIPIINLLATVIFFLANRKSTPFVRWHCTQALLSQFTIFFANSFGFWWTISIIFGDEKLSSSYIAYLLTVIVLNISELIITIITAIKTRKGEHVKWFFYGDLTNLFIKVRGVNNQE